MGLIEMMVDRINTWLRRRSRPSPGSLTEFESDPFRFTRSPWIRRLIASPLFNENVPTAPYDVLSISNPQKRTGFLLIKDLLRLEKIARYGSHGLYEALADDLTLAIYPEEFARVVAELRETCGVEPPCSGGGPTVADVQRAANGVIDAARKAQR